METYDLLLELATLDEVTAILPTAMDGGVGNVPVWCELLLEIRRFDDGTLTPAWPLNARLPLRRHDGELIIEALNEVLHPQLVDPQEALWVELDVVVLRIQRRVERGKEPRLKDVGQALGLATALAHLTGSDLDEIRGQAMTRFEGV